MSNGSSTGAKLGLFRLRTSVSACSSIRVTSGKRCCIGSKFIAKAPRRSFEHLDAVAAAALLLARQSLNFPPHAVVHPAVVDSTKSHRRSEFIPSVSLGGVILSSLRENFAASFSSLI